ncbi:mediator of RNA polymerase II transcription subunit 17-like isoform X3 [Dreissena polymorpha]|uniref:mediator of RNA polymerase II transcription subunit 17-like isoform X3 n=1 Tax=Dreissena polymorpha TaxID=45954 RepID=UPI00226401FB|nr:mediator of RNA polymerase II transcription subunit 17-like isoform X3 [Dreissena polymorpha]
MALVGVSVSIEAVQENKIQEVTLDGQEIVIPPLSMSESLAKSAQKIDFTEDGSEDHSAKTSEEETGDKEAATFQPSLWPWDSVRNKLKTAYTEVGVLLDVLNIAKEKKYMVLTHVQQDTSEPKSAVQLLAKKKGIMLQSLISGLSAASAVLLSGAERLKRSHEDKTGASSDKFHMELLKLRQSWRLKKVGNAIIGDLSYRSAGSRFWQGGTFEVTKNTGTSSGDQTDVGSALQNPLQVVIPSELEGTAYVQVEIKSVPDSMNLMSATLQMPDAIGRTPPNSHWQERLDNAQNLLFCKELFAQLAREAVKMKSNVPHVVVGNQIITNIFPGVQLSIVLCHSSNKADKKGVLQGVSQPARTDNKPVLEHSLHQLLREVHHKTLHLDPPQPATATFGFTKRRRLAGPLGLSRADLKEMADSETLLEQIIQQARHEVLKFRTMATIDRLAEEVRDPQIMAHWSCLNSPLQSNVKIIITSSGYEAVRVTFQSLDLEIGVDSLKAVTKDRRVLQLGFQEKEVEDLIRWQISQHHIALSQNIARMIGWEVLGCNGCNGVGAMEGFASSSSIQLVAPKNDRMLLIKSGPTSGLHVFLKIDNKDNLDPSLAALVDPKWLNLGGTFREIDMEQIEGGNLATKLELIMAMVCKKR